MSEHKSRAQLAADILSKVNFYDLTGTDSCLCADIRLQHIDIYVHCRKTRHQFVNYYGEKFHCECEGTGIHMTPIEPEDAQDLVAIGEIIRKELEWSGEKINITIHASYNDWQSGDFVKPKKGERPKEIIVPAST